MGREGGWGPPDPLPPSRQPNRGQDRKGDQGAQGARGRAQKTQVQVLSQISSYCAYIHRGEITATSRFIILYRFMLYLCTEKRYEIMNLAVFQ